MRDLLINFNLNEIPMNHAKNKNLSFIIQTNSQLNNRNKMLKRNLDEAEEEIQKEKTQKRKAQREMEDMLEAQEGLNRELNTLKSKLR
jgi:hypothetical protein